MQFTGTVKADEGFGYIIRDRDRHEIAERSELLDITRSPATARNAATRS